MKLGMTQTSFSGEPFGYGGRSLTGFAGGLSFERLLTPGASGVIEVLYVEMGAKKEKENTKWRFSYISIPAFLQYRFEISSGLSPKVFGGYALNLRLLSETDGKRGPGKRIDHGFVVGAGLDFMISRQEVTLDIRYYGGVSKFIESSNFFEFPEAKNRGVWILAGIRLF